MLYSYTVKATSVFLFYIHTIWRIQRYQIQSLLMFKIYKQVQQVQLMKFLKFKCPFSSFTLLTLTAVWHLAHAIFFFFQFHFFLPFANKPYTVLYVLERGGQWCFVNSRGSRTSTGRVEVNTLNENAILYQIGDLDIC